MKKIFTSVLVKKGDKLEHTLEYLGADVQTIKQHIENKFKENMFWDNYGEWHIDHIKPCIQYDLSKEKEQKKCFNYKNLQPLWAKDNLKKGDKY